MKELKFEQVKDVNGGSVCAQVGATATGLTGAGVASAATKGARLGVRAGIKGAEAGAIVGAATFAMCKALS